MIHLDSHGANPALTCPYDVVTGWFSNTESEAMLVLGSHPFVYSRIERRDLQGQGQGFCLYVDLVRLIGSDAECAERLPLSVVTGDTTFAMIDVAIPADVWAAAHDARHCKARKREWLQQTIRHPRTGERAAFEADAIVFPEADARFSQAGYGALNLLDPSFSFTGILSEKTDGVSAHHYPTPLQREIEILVASGGMALDFGAGLKKADHANIVRMEIFDYPSTDILCVGQKLPFPDGCFDMVMTLAVLEHVDDPFACAAEIMRVLKPGGRLFSGVPFLQPEHGYPDHYFNMTRSGHRKVYGETLEVERHMVDDHQHPFFSLQWMLNAYRNGLSPEAREEFSKMRVEDIVNMRYWRDRKMPVIETLSESAQWQLASATTLIGRKRST